MDRNSEASSAAAIRGHPLHPMVVPFPIAFLVAALGADVAFWATADPFWARAGLWLVGAGFFSAIAAAALGLIDFFSRPAVRRLPEAWGHGIGNAAVLVLALVSWSLRLSGGEAAVLPWGVALSLAIVLILLVTGWLGGELAYRHMVGVAADAKPPPGRSVDARARPATGR